LCFLRTLLGKPFSAYHKVNKELLKKYFQDNCTPEESEKVKYFLTRKDSFILIQQLFDEEWATFKAPQLDENALDSYHQRFLTEHSKKISPEKIKLFRFGQWLQYAAVLLLISGFAYYSVLRNQKNDKIAFLEKSNSNGERSIITLTDSTIVYLGAGSKLKFPENFVGDTREIALEGEAFFQVKKDHKHPFIIHTGSIQTIVLGTSFKIEAFAGHLFTVSVATGKVSVDRNDALPNKHLTSLAVLTPGQKITYNPTSKMKNTSLVSIGDLEDWKMGSLIFNKQRMDEVAPILERYYNVRIKISNKKVAAFRINTSFRPNESIEKVLEILSSTANFKYNKQGNQITII